jgi:hypothetical protein
LWEKDRWKEKRKYRKRETEKEERVGGRNV